MILKKQLFLFSLCAFLLVACKKSKPVFGLNSTEKQVAGIWYVTKQIDSQQVFTPGGVLIGDTTKTFYKTDISFTSADYINFKSSENSYNSTLDDFLLNCVDASFGLSTGSASAHDGGVNNSTFWYYDENSEKLFVGLASYDIVQVTSNTLILHNYTEFVPGLTKFNYNWCYLHR